MAAQHLAGSTAKPWLLCCKPWTVSSAQPLALIYHTDPLDASASRWEHWSEEAYEGWGWGGASVVANDAEASASTSAVAGDVGRGNSTFGCMFRRPGVVFPIHPTGHMRLPRPKLPFKQDGSGGDEGRVTFVVQVRVLSVTPGGLHVCFRKKGVFGRVYTYHEYFLGTNSTEVFGTVRYGLNNTLRTTRYGSV